MKKALALSKVYINSLFGIGSLINDMKRDKKSAAKKIGMVLLILTSMSGVITMMVAFNIKLFEILSPLNQQSIIITNSIVTASVFTIVIGIISIVATYFVNQEGDIILSMPLKPWNILFAKFSINYISQLLVAIFVMATGIVVYGVKSGSGIVFYLAAIFVTLLIPIIPIVICYVFIIPFMKVGGFLIKKDTLMILAGFIGVAFGVGVQIGVQSMIKLQESPQLLMEKLTAPDGLVSIAGRVYYPSIWGTYAINDALSFRGAGYFILFMAVSLMAAAALFWGMSKLYVGTLIGSGEVKKKTKSYSKGEFKGKFKRRPVLYSFLDREIKLMNREPNFFLNGPMVIFLMPLILGIMVYLQRDMLRDLNKFIGNAQSSSILTFVIAGACVFLGVSVNITSTSISREGRAFMYLKSMPIDPFKYINGKLLHGLLFGILGSLMVCAIAFGFLGISISNTLIAFILSILVMLPMLIIGLFLELAWPKLIWDNIQKPMKQNLNGVIIIFGDFFILGLLGMFVYRFGKHAIPSYIGISLISIIMSIGLYIYLAKYSKKRFYSIEI